MKMGMVRSTTLTWFTLSVVVIATVLAGGARADEDRARLTLAPKSVAAEANAGGLRMTQVASPAIGQQPGADLNEQLRRNKLYSTLGVAAVIGIAAILGGALAGPVYGAAAGGAVLLIYMLLP